MVVIRSLGFQLVPFKLHRFRKQRHEKGLFLLITSSGKYWRLKFRFGGKEKVLALGVYPEVSLRVRREEARRLLADGIDL
ncbi:Arm DNA-binding domain-containing protein [Aeromonas veronii]|uniref:Arm DNA-binding domain-containing protein n=2 Tax=Aeromonas veronii TaxID=654 RepID=UPI002443EB87|nr:Arm DNA-binding domain-containing protein [Aeromonas veronii]